jgi:hypothetical protein
MADATPSLLRAAATVRPAGPRLKVLVPRVDAQAEPNHDGAPRNGTPLERAVRNATGPPPHRGRAAGLPKELHPRDVAGLRPITRGDGRDHDGGPAAPTTDGGRPAGDRAAAHPLDGPPCASSPPPARCSPVPSTGPRGHRRGRLRRRAELMVTQDPATQDPPTGSRRRPPEGIGVPVVHGPFLLLTRRVFGTDLVEKARRSIELAGERRRRPDDRAPAVPLAARLPPLAARGRRRRGGRGRHRVGVENLYPVSVGAGRCGSTATRARAPRAVPPRRARHQPLRRRRRRHQRGLPAAARQAVHLHVSDNRGGGRDSHAPLGTRDAAARQLPPPGRPRRPRGVGEASAAGRCRSPSSSTAGATSTTARRWSATCARSARSAIALLEGAPPEEILGRPDVVSVAPGR